MRQDLSRTDGSLPENHRNPACGQGAQIDNSGGATAAALLPCERHGAMRQHRLVIWAHHGIMVRSSVSILHAADLVEYAETAAHYEYLNLTTGEVANGLSVEEISAICQAYHVEQTAFIR